ncbi:MAG: hypothetical protein ACR2GF_06020 [Acidimicrobiales bacterium]
MRRHPVAARAIVAATLVLAVSACGGSGGTSPTARSTTSTAVAASLASGVEGLCVARPQVAGDPAAVRGIFYDRSHDVLHTIARQLEAVDRALAARLLEAMQAVEADVSSQSPAASSAADLDRLIGVADQGLARLSVPVGTCR